MLEEWASASDPTLTQLMQLVLFLIGIQFENGAKETKTI